MFTLRKWALGLTVLASVATCLLWYFTPSFVAEPVKPIDLRLVKHGDLVAPGRIDVYHSPQELDAAYPADQISLERPVDFSRENLIRVGWRAVGCYTDEMAKSGPPTPLFGHLAHRSRNGGRDILFHVASPIGGSVFGQVVHEVFEQRLGESWFTVPKSSRLRYSDLGTPTPLDFVMALMVGVVIGLAMVWCVQAWKRRTASR